MFICLASGLAERESNPSSPAKKKDEYLLIFFLVFGNRVLNPGFAKQNIGGFGVAQHRKESTAGIFFCE